MAQEQVLVSASRDAAQAHDALREAFLQMGGAGQALALLADLDKAFARAELRWIEHLLAAWRALSWAAPPVRLPVSGRGLRIKRGYT